jgi:hypothetical protein
MCTCSLYHSTCILPLKRKTNSHSYKTAVKMLFLYILIFTRECECYIPHHTAQTFNISCNDCQRHTRWEFLITEQACRVLVWWVLTLIVDYAVIPLIWTEESLVVDTPVQFSVFSVAFVRAYNFHIKAAGVFCSLAMSLTSFWERQCNRKPVHLCMSVLDASFLKIHMRCKLISFIRV